MHKFKVGDRVVCPGLPPSISINGTIIEVCDYAKMGYQNAYGITWDNGRSAYVRGEGLEFIIENKVIDDNQHHGHDIVKNSVLGKEFSYCRNCKVEV